MGLCSFIPYTMIFIPHYIIRIASIHYLRWHEIINCTILPRGEGSGKFELHLILPVIECQIRRLGSLKEVYNTQSYCEYSERRSDVLQYWLKGTFGDHKVTWCVKPSRWSLQLAFSSHGNDPSVTEWYSATAVIITVPKWGARPLRCDIKSHPLAP